MKLISHRRNTIKELLATDSKYGVEVDIRSYGKKLIMHHEPLVKGEDFNEWLTEYNHGTLILNVKEEGLESRLIKLMKEQGIDDYFFLDQSFPFLVKWSNLGEKRCAVRISEYESIETALTLARKVNWVWVDCFTQFSLAQQDAEALNEAGFKICLVSPELQGRDAKKEIPLLADELKKRNIFADAVCTKNPEIWENLNL
jgi:hypothetical protein